MSPAAPEPRAARRNTVVLCAGRINPKNIPVGLSDDEGLIPVGGRPAIAWCLDSLFAKGAAESGGVDIVVRRANRRLLAILEHRYPEVRAHAIGEGGSILTSLAAGLAAADETAPTQVVLGDTAVQESAAPAPDVLLASGRIKASRPWCLVTRDAAGRLKDVYDKQFDVPIKGKLALVGHYSFSDTALLRRLVNSALLKGETELSGVLMAYAAERPLAVRETSDWLDFGHASGLLQARLSHFSTREFNAIRVDRVRGVLVKTSRKKQKLLDEVNWYRSLPRELALFAPRVAGLSQTPESVTVELELYGYQTLAELYLYGQNNLEDWLGILEALLEVHRLFRSHAAPPDRGELTDIYLVKTARRIEAAARLPHIAALMEPAALLINGQACRNLPALREDLLAATAALAGDAPRCVAHGDFCFSNILFDPLHFVFKLIDPRGRFKTQGIYGDPRYDIAKLRHSAVGLYDSFVAGLYSLERLGTAAYALKCPQASFAAALARHFDRLIIRQGYDLAEIRLIEGLLFLTMIPLHSDDPRRQTAFYLTAVRRLNEALGR